MVWQRLAETLGLWLVAGLFPDHRIPQVVAVLDPQDPGLPYHLQPVPVALAACPGHRLPSEVAS